MAVCLTALCPGIDTKPPVLAPCDMEQLKYGYKQPILIDCTYVFTDITDIAEWEAAITAGSISVMPAGKTVINAPTEQTYQYSDCDKAKLVYDTEYPVDITSPFFLPDGSECEYWQDFYDKQRFLRVVFRDCNGKMMLPKAQIDLIKANDNTVGGAAIGYVFSLSQRPHVQNQAQLAEWKTAITVAAEEVLCKYEIPGLDSAIDC